MAINSLPEEKVALEKLEQGGFHQIYLIFEYILINHNRRAKQQDYPLLEMLEKCAPELVQEINGKLYKRNSEELGTFMTLMRLFTKEICITTTRNILGIKGIDFYNDESKNNKTYMRVFFEESKKS